MNVFTCGTRSGLILCALDSFGLANVIHRLFGGKYVAIQTNKLGNCKGEVNETSVHDIDVTT